MEQFQIKIGTKIPTSLLISQSEYVTWFDCANNQKVIFQGLPDVNPLDILTLRNGVLEMGAFKHKDVLVFSYQLAMTGAYDGSITGECTYHPFIEDKVSFDFANEKNRVQANQIPQYEFVYVLFDTKSKYICDIRVFKASRYFTIGLSNMLHQVGLKSISLNEYSNCVQDLHKHPREAVAQFCTLREVMK